MPDMKYQSKPAKEIGERIEALRKQNKLTKVELGVLTGIRPIMFSEYKAGRRCVSIPDLIKIADALEVSTDYLLGRIYG